MRRRQVRVLPGALRYIRRHPTPTSDRPPLTQTGLARRVGCGVATIGMIESGERQPSADLATAIAEVLGCQVEDFAFYIEPVMAVA